MDTSENEMLAENKVLILYVLNKLNKPVTNDVLYSIIKSAKDVNYFYFQQFLLDLNETKYVKKFEKGNQLFYEITDEGKKTLDLTIDMLPGIIKLKADTNLKSNIENYENARSVVAEFTPLSEKEFEVDCKIVEKGEVIFEIKTLAYSRENAQAIVDNWKNNVQTLYPKLLKDLTEGSINK